MDERKEMSAAERTEVLTKWLRVLFGVKLLTLVATVLSNVPALSPVIVWVNKGISAALIVVLFQLAGTQERYRKAAVFYTIGLVGGLAGDLLDFELLSTVASVCSLIAMYQEFYGHGEVAAPLDASLAGKWHSLFFWQLVIEIAVGFLAFAAALLAVAAEVELNVVIIGLTVFIVALSAVFQLLYLRYLKKMQTLLA